jgi:ribonuclease D
MSTPNPVPLITTLPDLRKLAERLGREKLVSVDTESNSLHAYKEQVCLLQFSTAKEDALVDPLVLEDLSPLGSVFSDAKTEKIFHAAEYDLIVLQRDYGFTFNNLFDTMIAARILGRKKVGLGNLLEEEFEIKLEKRFQRADWGQRPLTQPMLEYARLDTHHLIDLREQDRWELAREDFDRLPSLIRTASNEPKEIDTWGIKGARDLKPQQAAMLQELARYREEKAEAADVPLFKVIGDSTLTAIAAAEAKTLADLKDIPGMTEGQIRRHGKGLLAAVARGASAEPLRRPKRLPYDEAYVERLDALRAWRKKAALEMEVESDIVLPRDIMEATARQNPSKLKELEPLMARVPWRLKNFGEHIVAALHPTP